MVILLGIINFILYSEQKWLGSHCFVDWQREAHGRHTHNQRPKHGCKLNTDHIWQNHAHSQIRAHRSAKTNRAVHGVSCAACVACSNTPLSLAFFFLYFFPPLTMVRIQPLQGNLYSSAFPVSVGSNILSLQIQGLCCKSTWTSQ